MSSPRRGGSSARRTQRSRRPSLAGYVETTAALSEVALEAQTGRGSRDAEESPGLVPLVIEVRGEAGYEALLRFVQRLEAGPILIRLVVLSVDAVPINDAGAQNRSDGVLAFTAAIESHAWISSPIVAPTAGTQPASESQP